jgi:hypothetical protein
MDEAILLTPSVLTDVLYEAYGGDVNIATPGQRNAAYVIGETLVARELGAFLSPLRVTGSYAVPFPGRNLQLNNKRVHSVDAISYVHGCMHSCLVDSCSGGDACAFIINGEEGVIKVTHKAGACCSCNYCSCGGSFTYALKVVYTSGLSSAYAAHPILLMALTQVAGLALQQIIDPAGAAGGVGDPGLKEWSNMRYRQVMVDGVVSALGASPIAQYATGLLKGLKRMRAMRLG